MKTYRPTPAHEFGLSIRKQLTDIGQEYFDTLESSEYGRLKSLVADVGMVVTVESIEFAAYEYLADVQPSRLPDAWHEGVSFAMHSHPIDCNPYDSGSENAIAFNAGWRSENA